jgi:hypothetical protein
MRIWTSTATAQATQAPASRRTASGGFSVPDDDEPKSTSSAVSLRTVGGIDALLALQGQEDATERRRRGVRRGRVALDALDDLKVGLLGGAFEPSMLHRLKSAAAELSNESGEPALDAVLEEIDLRVQVEIAKLTAR